MLFGPIRLVLRILGLIAAALLVYFAVTLVQVWLTSRQYDPHPAGAIVVMGTAEYNGTPSSDLEARLDEAYSLFHNGYAKVIMVTGGKKPGDVYTESEAGRNYLETKKGVPPGDILMAGGDDSYQNMADAAPQLLSRHLSVVLVVTDPFHEFRSMAIASALKLKPSPTPTHTSPITGWAKLPYFLKEAVGVGFGRVIGYNHLEWLHDA